MFTAVCTDGFTTMMVTVLSFYIICALNFCSAWFCVCNVCAWFCVWFYSQLTAFGFWGGRFHTTFCLQWWTLRLTVAACLLDPVILCLESNINGTFCVKLCIICFCLMPVTPTISPVLWHCLCGFVLQCLRRSLCSWFTTQRLLSCAVQLFYCGCPVHAWLSLELQQSVTFRCPLSVAEQQQQKKEMCINCNSASLQ